MSDRLSRYRLRRALMLAGLLILPPARLAAQTEPPDPTGPPPDGGDASASAAVPRWTTSIGLERAWSSNPLFTTAPVEDRLDRVVANLSRTWRGRHSHLTFTAGGSALLYRELSDLNTFNFSGTLAGSQRLSSRLTGTLGESLTSAYTRELDVLVDSALLLPLTRAVTNRASAGLSWRLSPVTTTSLDVRDERVYFESPTLTDGSSQSATLSLRRGVARRASVSLSYAFNLTRLGPSTRGTVHSVLGTWTAPVGRYVTVLAGAGASRLEDEGHPPAATTPIGEASLTLRRRGQNLDLRYARTVDQAYGLGRIRVVDLVSGTYGGRVKDRVEYGVTYGFGHSTDPKDPAFLIDGSGLDADLRFGIVRHLWLGVGYSYRRNESPSFVEPITDKVWSVALDCRFESRGAHGRPGAVGTSRN